MAILAGQGPEEMKITVRNTFLNVLEDDEAPLFRTSSDPLGGQCEMQARHIAQAKQLASNKLFTHDESTETTETNETASTLEDPAICRSLTWDPLENTGGWAVASQDASPVDDVTDLPVADSLPSQQAGAIAPEGVTPTRVQPVVKSPAPLTSSPFAGGLAPLNSMPSDLSPSSAPWMPSAPVVAPVPVAPVVAPASTMTAFAQPFVPVTGSWNPGYASVPDADTRAEAFPWQMDRQRKGNGKGSKGKVNARGRGGDVEHVTRATKDELQLGSIVLESFQPSISSQAPQFAFQHHFHAETAKMGSISADYRTFTKEQYEGRLSVVTEDRVHKEGSLNRYLVQFCSGELSNADGVGFIFSNKLPCPKNIQKIVSIFANKTGRLCMRAYDEVLRSETTVKPLELGDWIELEMDLEKRFATFTVWPADRSRPTSATLNFGSALDSIRRVLPSVPQCISGYLAVVVKHTDVMVNLAS